MDIDTITITCDCGVCDGLAAKVRAGAEATVSGDSKDARTTRHNLVRLAHGPLARAQSVRDHGPWAV